MLSKILFIISRQKNIFLAILALLILSAALFVYPKENANALSGQIQVKMANGSKPDMKKWPWIASYYDISTGSYCGGSLINRYWVLTAAHCLVDSKANTSRPVSRNPNRFRVGIGQPSIDKTPFQVRDIYIHPLFKSYKKTGSTDNDLALIRLKQPISKVAPVSLPINESLSGPGPAEMAGYGMLCRKETSACFGKGALFEGKVDIQNKSQCDKVFNLSPNRPLICTLPAPPKYSAACFGDSGGPLVAYNQNNKAVLIGVIGLISEPVSDYCGFKNTAGSFSTFHYLSWINRIIKSK